MICYNHPEEQAHGICKNCNKGICAKCSTDIQIGLSCSDSCSDELKAIDKLINKSKSRTKEYRKVEYGMSLFYLLLGTLILALPFIYQRFNPVSIAFGVIIILFGLYKLYHTNKMTKESDVPYSSSEGMKTNQH